MNLAQLKAQVYQRAQVTSTPALKRYHPQLKALDFRYRLAWEQSLVMLSDAPGELEHWRTHPPAEYRELFREVEVLSQRQHQLIAEAKQQVAEIRAIARQAEKCSQTLKDEATAQRRQQRTAHQASKN
ncbi:MAG: hypothetical protein HC919_12560 [Oscillatoriales cyanobacterium SM2_2_1]|nr:hypothetical protein [Oscillatoriales cyanobacterium SM2_2_1]